MKAAHKKKLFPKKLKSVAKVSEIQGMQNMSELSSKEILFYTHYIVVVNITRST